MRKLKKIVRVNNHTYSNNGIDKLNDLLSQGWEVVSVEKLTGTDGSECSDYLLERFNDQYVISGPDGMHVHKLINDTVESIKNSIAETVKNGNNDFIKEMANKFFDENVERRNNMPYNDILLIDNKTDFINNLISLCNKVKTVNK